MSKDRLKDIIAHAKEYGFVFPSSEIYDGLSATYDYGPFGVELKNNIKYQWWNSIVHLNDNITGLDTAVFMHPKTWKASGHLEAFNDPMIDNKDSKNRYRADTLIEEHIEKLQKKIDKELQKAKKFGEDFDEEKFKETNPRVIKYKEKINTISDKLKKCLENNDLEGLKTLIEELEIACPVSGTKNWTDVRQFNLMFQTELGSLSEDSNKIYLRPETCQGIFVNFLNVMNTTRKKLPFGIAQIGKAFRNEIVARQFIFRMREFEQMEMQFFVKPGNEMEWFEYWKEERIKWHRAMGLKDEDQRQVDHLKLPHYANAATDIEFNYPMGFKELEGIHSRTDHDLRNHEKYSGKRLRCYDETSGENIRPFVIETSIGLDRFFMAVFSQAFEKEQLDDGSERTVLKFSPLLAPVK
ncbi:MAG: glycine--tRNA ligase, partial [Flavobacteriales bacterium]